MKRNCQRCEKAYEAKRARSKFCSATCRVAFNKKKRAASPPVAAELIVEQPYAPSGEASVLALLIVGYECAVDKLMRAAAQLKPIPAAAPLLQLLEQLSELPRNEIVQRIEEHDFQERFENPSLFKARTGLPQLVIPPLI